MNRLTLLTLIFAAAGSAATPADSLIRTVETRYNNARTLTAEFTEQYSVLGRARRPESGTLSLRKQGKMRWDYDRPPGKLFVSDGKTVYLYMAADHRVAKVPMKQTDDMRAPLAFLLGKLDLSRDFRDFAVQDDAPGTHRLTARAKSDRVPYTDLQMKIADNGAIEELVVNSKDQSTLTFSFRDERLNPPLPDALFTFAIPPGTEVVDALPASSEGQ